MSAYYLLLLFLCPSISSGQSVSNLTINNIVNPLAIDIDWNPSPIFSWALSGGAQASYAISVVSLPSLSPVWSSGVVASSQSTQISYGGAALAHDSDYQVSVSLTFSAGGTASTIGTFSTGLDSSAWAKSGVWMGGCTEAQASPQLRLSFTLSSQSIDRARLYATALGIYTVHLNGARVGEGTEAVLTPGWSTVPTYRVLADVYDVSSMLVPGKENVLGVRLGQGKYGYVYEFCAAGDATCYASLLQLSLSQADGSNVTIVASSAEWTCAPSPITFNHLFGGETYDARLEQEGWCSPGFVPTSPWTPVPIKSNVTTALVSPSMPAIAVMATVSPISVRTSSSGSPVIAGGSFIISNDTSNPDVWWWPTNSKEKWFLAVCSPCPSVSACANLTRVSEAFIDSLTTAPANFSCSLLPTDNATTAIFDLGSNMAGFCSLALPTGAPAGTVLSLVHGEILDSNGNVDNTFGTSGTQRSCNPNVINCADQLDQYIYSEAGPSSPTYTPSLTFHGFRFVALFGWPSGNASSPIPPPTTDTLVCHQTYSRMAAAGGVNFNSSILNALQVAVVQTQKSNLFSIPSGE